MHSYPKAARKPDTIDLAWITLGFLEIKGIQLVSNFIETNLKPTARVSWSQNN